MAQPLSPEVPAFPLTCDNKFSADVVLKRWSYIIIKCQQSGITVLCFGADCDSRELKNMQFSTELFTTYASTDVHEIWLQSCLRKVC